MHGSPVRRRESCRPGSLQSPAGVNDLPSTIVSGDELIAQLLEQKPEIAVFDCDGTLWSGDSGAEFFYW